MTTTTISARVTAGLRARILESGKRRGDATSSASLLRLIELGLEAEQATPTPAYEETAASSPTNTSSATTPSAAPHAQGRQPPSTPSP